MNTVFRVAEIVRAMAESGSTVLQMPVAQVMTRHVSTRDVNDSTGSVIDRVTKGKFRHMLMLDNDRLVGLVSIGDVLKWHVETIREHIDQLEACLIQFKLARLYISLQPLITARRSGNVTASDLQMPMLSSHPTAINRTVAQFAKALHLL